MGLAPLVLSLLASGALTATAERDALIRRGLQELQAGQFEPVLGSCAELRRRFPDDPAGYVLAADVYQTTMRDYRIRALEPQFQAVLRDALEVADRAVRSDPSPDALFARGTARAYQAVHRFTTGDWVPALFDAMRGVRDARRAGELDASFADPALAMALHDYWKAETLGLGIGLFRGGRRTVVGRLERVRREGRFLRVEAAYALETVHYRQGDLGGALAANEWLYAQFPSNPVCLYHRALILEGLGRVDEALDAWDALLGRLQEFPHRSDGFLAECHLHRAQILARRGGSGDAAALASAAQSRRAAQEHAARRDAHRELEGPLVPFKEVRRDIERLGHAPVSVLAAER